MGLESPTYIDDLVTTNPTAGDQRSEGDDHIRNIKAVLKNSLPDVDQAVSTIISSTTEPALNRKGTLWLDETTNLVKLRNTADTAWITLPFSMTASNTVDIDGGAIDGTPIGGTTPAAGDFTTLDATGAATVGGTLQVTGLLTALASLSITGNITLTGTVDGRDVATDGTKLDGITAGAEPNVALASQAEAEAGTENTKTMTALRTAQAITAIGQPVEVTATGTVTVPATTTRALVLIWGGGAGGDGGWDNAGGGGGGSGAFAVAIETVTGGSTPTVTIGAGGIGGTGQVNDVGTRRATAGTNSSFGNTTAGGGAATSGTTGGVGGTVTTTATIPLAKFSGIAGGDEVSAPTGNDGTGGAPADWGGGDSLPRAARGANGDPGAVGADAVIPGGGGGGGGMGNAAFGTGGDGGDGADGYALIFWLN